MSRQIKSLKDVVDWGLCTGCGACFYACRNHGISLVNLEPAGIRPRFNNASCGSCTECLSVCPGYSVDAHLANGHHRTPSDGEQEFGHSLEIWEGHAADPEIRHRASSGGLLSALAVYCLEKEGMEFVLHAGMDETKPWTNRTVQSRSRAEVLARAGSRYAPASPCDGLGAIEKSEKPCVFIGKPCDAAAVGMLRKQRPELDGRLGLVLTFFCAGAPSTQGTLDLAKSLGAEREEIRSVRYRGEGWPGRFKVVNNSSGEEKSLSYAESWGKLTHYRTLRCHLCPDGLGRVADISCGDAWEQFDNGGDEGHSIAVVRTARGREILHRAMKEGYVELKPVGAQAVLAAQQNLLSRRRELFGRLAAMRLFLVPVPQFRNFSLFESWAGLPLRKRIRTVVGTGRRIFTRGMWRRRPAF